MLVCRQCHQEGFLILGQCEKCNPQLHADHATSMEFIERMTKEWETVTGKSSLADFDLFEAFCLERLRDM